MSAPIGSMRDLLMDIFAIVLDDENTSVRLRSLRSL